jgi:DNA polymerase-3 subunit chi
MAEIGFYHLTRTGPDQALPALLARTLQAGKRAVIRCAPENIAALDAALWAVADWLPHGTETIGHADLQPIWITGADDAPNGASFLFLVDGVSSDRLDAFERVFDLFDGSNEPAVGAARRRWAAAKSAGHALTYWQQGPGGWTKK